MTEQIKALLINLEHDPDFAEGFRDYHQGKTENPYSSGSPFAPFWQLGFHAGKIAAEYLESFK